MRNDSRASPPTSSEHRRKRWAVLLVDADEDSRSRFAEYLRVAGCFVEEAEDGREALAKALATPYDVIVMEAHVPGIDGYQLCGVLRRDPSTQTTPVLMLTSDGLQANLDRAHAAGADAIFVKPASPEALLVEIRRVLESESEPCSSARRASADEGATHADVGLARAARSTPRPVMSRAHLRGDTTKPPIEPPALVCPLCDRPLVYARSHLGGVSARHSEQWDYFECPGRCGTFEYRQRTRKLRKA
jgi:CheY-like chemotaxis protein